MNISSDIDVKNKGIILYEYEQILVGNAKDFKVSFNTAGSTEIKKKIVAVVWRYAIEKILKWTPLEALELLNIDIIKSLKLNVAMRHIDLKVDAKSNYSLRQLLNVVYPNEISYNFEDEAISEFKRINQLDEYSEVAPRRGFNTGFFAGADGRKRASIILRYAINMYFGDKPVYDCYKFFAKGSDGRKFMRQNKISGILTACNVEPLVCMHNALPPERQNEVFYINEYLKNLDDFEELNRLMTKIVLTNRTQAIQKQKDERIAKGEQVTATPQITAFEIPNGSTVINDSTQAGEESDNSNIKIDADID